METVAQQKQRLLDCSEKLREFTELIEPLFKAGHEGFAPDTDWWCVIAGLRHNSLADVRFLSQAAEALDKPHSSNGTGIWQKQMLQQRKRAVAEHEVESPCGDGCVLTWNAQYKCLLKMEALKAVCP